MVIHSTVETRAGILKDEYVQMDMEHRRQEQKIESLEKEKEAEVSVTLVLSWLCLLVTYERLATLLFTRKQSLSLSIWC